MATLSSQVILDTSVFIDHLRHGHHQERIDSLTGLVRTSSVVLAELWRGATKPADKAYLRALEKNLPVLVPTRRNWLDSGQVLSQIREDRGFTPEKLRNLHFDVLIALTADFELIASYGAARSLILEFW